MLLNLFLSSILSSDTSTNLIYFEMSLVLRFYNSFGTFPVFLSQIHICINNFESQQNLTRFFINYPHCSHVLHHSFVLHQSWSFLITLSRTYVRKQEDSVWRQFKNHTSAELGQNSCVVLHLQNNVYLTTCLTRISAKFWIKKLVF